eukprot:642691-Amphidinium_carterae.3
MCSVIQRLREATASHEKFLIVEEQTSLLSCGSTRLLECERMHSAPTTTMTKPACASQVMWTCEWHVAMRCYDRISEDLCHGKPCTGM